MTRSDAQPAPLWAAIEADDHEASGSGLQTIPPDICMQLLADTTTVGRVGFRDENGQQLVPVNFVYRDDCIYFRTSARGFLARLGSGDSDVAFEIDHIDLLTQTGWSVLAKGETKEARDVSDLGPEWLRPWAGGDRSVIIRLTPHSVTGRRVRKPGSHAAHSRDFYPDDDDS
jgi:nitroimidazol reductase NimA-like FMN-containing flavoprotein (pyridoxamine 5'-phosphate oxidase superfamily)